MTTPVKQTVNITKHPQNVLFVLVEKPKVLENTNNQVQIIKYIYIDDMCLNKNNIVVNNQLKGPLQDIPGDPADIICHPHSLHMDQWW